MFKNKILINVNQKRNFNSSNYKDFSSFLLNENKNTLNNNNIYSMDTKIPYFLKKNLFSIFKAKENNNNFKFINLIKHNFSIVEKIKLQDKIRLVDITEVLENSSEYAFEQLQFYLTKENFKSFIEDFQNYSQKGVVLELDKLNILMGMIYTKNFKIIELIQEYIFEKNIRLDSLGYNYVILATLKNIGFEKAYNLFIEASIFGIQQNLNVIVSLLSEIDNSDVSDKNKCINFILHHLQKFYSEEVLK